MQTLLRQLNIEDPLACPVCLKRLKTAQGVLAHLSSARRCREHKKGKIRELTLPGPGVLSEGDLESVEREVLETVPTGSNNAEREAAPTEVINEHLDRFYDLVPLDSDIEEWNSAGPSLRPSQEPELDERVEEDPFPLAGKVIRMDATLHDKWREMFGGEDMDGDAFMNEEHHKDGCKFAPFASEVDWRVARWAIQEGIGHKSFDRLLSIPGVSIVSIFIYNLI